jgi:two-component system, OmpR family, sensor histidine kinase BaeS
VLRNLLGNAVRHTREGSIEVTVEVRGSLAEVRVRDTGEGIAAEDLPHIFERFYRADSVRSPGAAGAGLGLSISRRIIEDHGGEMFAESRPGSGTSVGFRLPLSGGHSAEPAAPSLPAR